MKPVLLLSLALVALGLSALPAGAAANCTISGTAGDDVFTTEMQTDGADDICGLGGNDVFEPSPGNDFYYGDTGRDTVDYSTVPENAGWSSWSSVIYLHPSGGTADTFSLGQDGLNRIENVVGTPFKDYVNTVNTASNRVEAGTGNDLIEFGLTGDKLYGEGGYDTLRICAGPYSTSPRVVDGGHGVDAMDGSCDASTSGATFDFVDQTYASFGGGFRFQSIRDGVGTQLSDTMYGNRQVNTFKGGSGDDFLDGGAGDDYLYGQSDTDYANGRAGSDACQAEVQEFCER